MSILAVRGDPNSRAVARKEKHRVRSALAAVGAANNS